MIDTHGATATTGQDPMTAPRVGRLAMAIRVVTVSRVVLATATRLAIRVIRRPADRTELAGAAVTDALERLGPAYVKFGQVLSTRPDLLPPATCRTLARLYDGVRPPDPAATLDSVPAGLLAMVDGGRNGLRLVAAGSIACVYRARLTTGEQVAVKVRRPGIAGIMAVDIALLRSVARLGGRLPGLRGAPLAEIISQLGDSVYAQLDLVQEAESLALLRSNLAGLAGVRIPVVLAGFSGPEVLVAEFVDGLRRDDEPTPGRRAAVLAGLRATYQMLFRDGFVHCDLHPGNLYLMSDGSAVIVDAGFTRRLTELARRKFAEFFYYLGRNDGPRCAEILLSTSLRAHRRADPEGFRADVIELVRGNSRVSAADFDLVNFAFRLFAVQRSRGFYADPQFIFPILALIVLEGTVRDLAPDIDFQAEAVPYVLRGLQETASVRTG